MLSLVLFFVSFLCPVPGEGNTVSWQDEKSATLVGRVVEPMEADVEIRISSVRDTLYTFSDADGFFSFKGLKPGKVSLRVRRMGYLPFSKEMELVEGANALFVTLELDRKRLKEAKVTAEIEPMRMRGDTIVYNAAAVGTLSGDNAMQVFEQMPGVEKRENALYVFGKKIKRTYVNGVLVFGDDPETALNHLLASDVRQIKVFDQVSDEDRRHGVQQTDKDRVLDILTNRPVDMALDAHFLASAGKDAVSGGGDARYAMGATANFFSERFLLFGNAYRNNADILSNRMEEIRTITPLRSENTTLSKVEAGMDRYWGDRFDGSHLRFAYSFDRNDSRFSEKLSRHYTGMTPSAPMEYLSLADNLSSTSVHHLVISSDLCNERWNRLSFSISSSFEDKDNSESLQNSLNRGDVVSCNHDRKDKQTDGRSMEGRAEWLGGGYGKAFSPFIQCGFFYSDSDFSNTWIDTSFVSTERRNLWMTGTEGSSGMQLSSGFRGTLLNRASLVWILNVRGEYTAEQGRHSQDAEDRLFSPSAVDPVNTFDYSTRSRKGQIVADTQWRIREWRIGSVLKGGTVRLRDGERVPVLRHATYAFPFLCPSFYVSYRENRISFSYETSHSEPVVEQIRGWLDTSNPLLFRMGNPDLKSSYSHSFSLLGNGSIPSTQGSFFFKTAVRFDTQSIVPRMIQRDEPSTLGPFVIPAGKVLYSWANASGGYTVNAVASYRQRFKSLKGSVQCIANYDQYRSPQWENDSCHYLVEHAPSVSLFFSGTITGRFRYNIHSKETLFRSFSQEKAPLLPQRLNHSLSASLRLDFARKASVSGSYSFHATQFFADGYKDVLSNHLGGMLAYRFHKDRFVISLVGTNLLDSTPAYTMQSASNYFQETWRNYNGRRIMLHLTFRFNRIGKGDPFRGELLDG